MVIWVPSPSAKSTLVAMLSIIGSPNPSPTRLVRMSTGMPTPWSATLTWSSDSPGMKRTSMSPLPSA